MTTLTVIPKLSGGLGNRLFQLYAALGVAETLGSFTRVAFALDVNGKNDHGNQETIYRLFSTIPVLVSAEKGSGRPIYEWKEPLRMHHVVLPLDETARASLRDSSGTLLIGGWRQCIGYFPDKLPVPNWPLALRGASELVAIQRRAGLETEADRRRTWAVHVRLGDYRILRHHLVDLTRYYDTTIAQIPVGSRVLFFSDEPELCAQSFGTVLKARGLEFSVCTEKEDVAALYAMSLCWGGVVMGNSSFSWWGAFFARSGAGAEFRATMPDRWGSTPDWPRPDGLRTPWITVVSVSGSDHLT